MIDIIKVILPTAATFVVGIAVTPLVAHYLYKYKAWKKASITRTTDGREATITQKLHPDDRVKTPRMGGIVVWLSVVLVTLGFWIAAIVDGPVAEKLNFLSRNQTWLPLLALLVGALIGMFDDIMAIRHPEGFSSTKRLLLVGGSGLVAAWWFYDRLATDIIIPFFGTLDLGILFVPFFVVIMIGIYAGGVIDGIDGLAGGVFAAIFVAYGFIAFAQNQIDIAALSFAIFGGLLAFLWFNIPPARFYISDTGTTAVTMALTVIAFLTKQVVVLPIIAGLLVLAAGSSALQLLSKKLRNGKKVFIVAPIHHHFQALGWPAEKVTMRFWILGIMLAFIGVIIALTGNVTL